MENEDELQLDEELQHMRIMKGVEGMFSNVVFEKFKMI